MRRRTAGETCQAAGHRRARRQQRVAALWPEVERLAERGLVAFAYVSAIPYVAPAGGTKPVFGTNPMAFAWPRLNRPPLVFDQASSASARGEIQLRLRDGKSLPEGWAIGPDGRPTTDPKGALAGAQLPFGGVKGSSIALMVELLAGPLLGDVLSFEAGEDDRAMTGAPCGGELVVAIDPARCVGRNDSTAQLAQPRSCLRRFSSKTARGCRPTAATTRGGARRSTASACRNLSTTPCRSSAPAVR